MKPSCWNLTFTIQNLLFSYLLNFVLNHDFCFCRSEKLNWTLRYSCELRVIFELVSDFRFLSPDVSSSYMLGVDLCCYSIFSIERR